jgi:hypothetical protein
VFIDHDSDLSKRLSIAQALQSDQDWPPVGAVAMTSAVLAAVIGL